MAFMIVWQPYIMNVIHCNGFENYEAIQYDSLFPCDTVIKYHANGKIKSIGYYCNDTLNGEYKEFSSSGQLVYSGFFVNGIQDGKSVFQDSTSSSKAIYIYDMGNMTEMQDYSEAGELIEVIKHIYVKKQHIMTTICSADSLYNLHCVTTFYKSDRVPIEFLCPEVIVPK